jgi:hypothetical protein
MSSDITFQLDIEAADIVLTDLAAPIVKQSADAIAARAEAMAASMTSKPIAVGVSASVGIIKRGRRAIATVTAAGSDPHTSYLGHKALMKAKDAGRI